MKPPARLSENYFRLFERTIAQAILDYPGSVVIGPQGNWSIATTLGRLRDAVLSYRRFHWDSTLIDADLFVEVWPRIQPRLTGNFKEIVLGPRVRAAGRPAVPEAITVREETSGLELSQDEVLAYMTLLVRDLIRGPVLITGYDLDALKHFAGDRDLEVFEQDKKIYIL